MTTIKQELALSNVVENGGNITQAMRDVGYSEATVNNPSNLTKSKGFLELCEDSGLTDDFLLQALVQDIQDKKGNRRAELELAFKIKGKLIQKADITSNFKSLSLLDESMKMEIDRAFSSMN
jgi:hypothetical protein